MRPKGVSSISRTSPQFAHSLSLRCDSQTEQLSKVWSGSGTLCGSGSSYDGQRPKNMMVVVVELRWDHAKK